MKTYLPKKNFNLSQVIHEVPVEKMNEFVEKVEELKKNL